MASLKLLPGGKTGDFQNGTRLLDAMLEMGALVKTPCGGRGVCGKCRTRVAGEFSDPTDAETKFIGNRQDIRLACQATLTGDVAVYADEAQFVRPDSLPAADPADRYAIAADVGTTSISLALVNVSRGEQNELGSFLNPQGRFGHDVISRIAAAKERKARDAMGRLVRNAVMAAIEHALHALQLPVERIERIVFSGNTTMMYLLFGQDPSPLGQYPFTAEHLDFKAVPPSILGSGMRPHVHVAGLPAVSAFLGGDFLGGLTLCRRKGFGGYTFFIDLGTNGEMFVASPSGDVFAASCAMGPALEGMNISCGMTADEGAVTHVRIEGGALVYSMIGEGPPVGLTGTALIDLAAIFLSQGWISESGAFAAGLAEQKLFSPARFEGGATPKKMRLWENIFVSQKDIRNLQLAKGASLAATRFLLRAADCAQEEVRHVAIAGALGTHLDLDNFKRLGFVPSFSTASWHNLGNTSLQAAVCACFEERFVRQAAEQRGRVKEVELAADPAFNRDFLAALNFEALR